LGFQRKKSFNAKGIGFMISKQRRDTTTQSHRGSKLVGPGSYFTNLAKEKIILKEIRASPMFAKTNSAMLVGKQ